MLLKGDKVEKFPGMTDCANCFKSRIFSHFYPADNIELIKIK